jgi:hypothetical protein
MADRTVTVKLEADVGGFVANVGGKAVAAVEALNAAAKKANISISKVGKDASFDAVSKRATTASEKVSQIGVAAEASGSKVKASATVASEAVDKVTASTTKASKATTDNSKAITVSTKNADSYASALGRLRVAQLRLTETQNRKGSSGSALAGAEESVAAAERAVKKFEKAGNDSGKSFTTGLRKWLTGNGGVADVGKAGGTVFGSGFLGVLKTPILGPAVVAILTAAVVTAMPAVGAIAGGALVTGFGLGLAGMAGIFAAKSQVVQDKWKATLSTLGADMQLISKPFESVLSHIADYFKRTVDRFNPAWAAAFADLAGPVDTFVDKTAKALERLIPSVAPITAAFIALLGSLGDALPAAIDTMAGGFERLAASVQKNPAAMADTVKGLAGIVAVITDFITLLNDINSKFSDLTGGISLVTVVMKGLEGVVAGIAAPFRALSAGLSGVNALLGRTGGDVDTAGKSMSDAAAKTADLAGRVNGLAGSAQHAGAPVKTMAEQVAEAKKKIADAKAATDTWITSLFTLQGLALSLSGAQISFQAAIDATTASIKENGRTHDINTAKGRANKTALDALAKSANDQTEAMLRSGKGNAAAGKSALSSRDNFIKLATQMGYTVPQAQRMAASMIAIPNVLRTAKLEADKKDLDKKIAAAKAQLADPHLTATKRAKLQAEIKQLLAAKAQAQAAIDSLSGKTVSLTINTYKNMVETTTHVDKGVRVPAAPVKADGGYHPGGWPTYADGKLPQQAMVARGKGRGMVQWAEQETGGEAFIPMAPSKRQRSTSILGQVADNFGFTLVKSFADGGFLPGGKLVDIAFLLRQLGIPFNPSAGVNYGSTLAAQNKAVSQVRPAKAAANTAARAEAAAKAEVARIQRAITLQQREINKARQVPTSKAKDKDDRNRGNAARDKKIKQEQADLIKLQDQLYRAKIKQKSATDASNKADATYRLRADAATKATEAHKAAIEKLIQQQQAAVDMAAQISDALTSGANIGDLFQNSLTGKGLLADLQAQGAQTGVFRGQIDKLRKQGLSEDLIQQIIGKGVEQGGEVAQAILDGGLGLVAALNKAQKALDDQANLIGVGSANKKYGQTIAGARADGGDVMAGKIYRVNERGEEFFQPGVTGRILPHQYVGSIGSGGSTAVRENHYHLKQEFTGVSMAEADLIGRRALGALRLAGRR